MKPLGSPQKPTLESLLRVKRAERPDPEFWQHFERELRRKQLAATIEPKPWWLGVSILARKCAPVGLPVGAAAAAVLAAISAPSLISGFRVPADNASQVAQVVPSTVRQVTESTGSTEPVEAKPLLVAADNVGTDSLRAIAPVAADSAPDHLVAAAEVSLPENVSSESASGNKPAASVIDAVATLVGMPSALDQVDEDSVAYDSPSQRHIMDNLSAARELDPYVGVMLGLDYTLGDLARLEVSSQATKAAREARAQHDEASEISPRSARLLAMADRAAEQESAVVSANIAREQSGRLNDDVLYASALRRGVVGDRFSISF